jgi:hypothetical protein
MSGDRLRFGLAPLNHPAAGKAGIGSRLTIGHRWPGLPEPGRSICMRVALSVLMLCGVASTCSAAGRSSSPYQAKVRSALQALGKNQNSVAFLLSLTNLPAAVRAKLGSIADVGQPYSDGCIGRDPHRRFLLATKADRTFNVAFEQGGFVPTWYIWQFVLDTNGKVIRDQEIEPNGAANRSQPVRPDTNRTSSAAGSAR